MNKPINTMKNFADRHKVVSQRKLQEETETKEIRFPMLFKKIIENSNQFKGPNHNFELFSKTPYNKLIIMMNVKQTLRIQKR